MWEKGETLSPNPLGKRGGGFSPVRVARYKTGFEGGRASLIYPPSALKERGLRR
jgi:hypothetical protein